MKSYSSSGVKRVTNSDISKDGFVGEKLAQLEVVCNQLIEQYKYTPGKTKKKPSFKTQIIPGMLKQFSDVISKAICTLIAEHNVTTRSMIVKRGGSVSKSHGQNVWDFKQNNESPQTKDSPSSSSSSLLKDCMYVPSERFSNLRTLVTQLNSIFHQERQSNLSSSSSSSSSRIVVSKYKVFQVLQELSKTLSSLENFYIQIVDKLGGEYARSHFEPEDPTQLIPPSTLAIGVNSIQQVYKSRK